MIPCRVGDMGVFDGVAAGVLSPPPPPPLLLGVMGGFTGELGYCGEPG